MTDDRLICLRFAFFRRRACRFPVASVVLATCAAGFFAAGAAALSHVSASNGVTGMVWMSSPTMINPQIGVPGGRGSSEPTGDSLVKVEAAVIPAASGKKGEFELAVIFQVTPGWHIYWTNPGEGGIPTSVKVTAPSGVQVGEPIFQAPERFGPPGEASYGYGGTAVVFVPLKPVEGDSLPEGEIRAATSWLVCKEICLSGSRTVTASTKAAPSPAANAQVMFARTKLPRPIADWQGAQAKIVQQKLVIQGPAQGAKAAEFFPADTPGVTYGRPSITTDGDRIRIEMTYTLRPEDALGKPMRLGGVVTLKRLGQEPSYEFSIPAPSQS